LHTTPSRLKRKEAKKEIDRPRWPEAVVGFRLMPYCRDERAAEGLEAAARLIAEGIRQSIMVLAKS
jgi:hypothetical protein